MGERANQEQISSDSKGSRNVWNLKQYVIIALVIFVTFCCCILFFFMIYRYHGFADFWKELRGILQPITIGVVLAYLLNPIMKFQEKYLIKFLEPRMKSAQKARAISRGIAIAGSLVFLIGIIVLLIAAIVPSVLDSIQGMVTTLPEEVNNLIAWADDYIKADNDVADFLNQMVEKATSWLQTFLQDILSYAQTYIASIISGVVYGVKLFINILVGLVVSVYVLASKEKFAGQAKKIVYALFKPVRANVIVETVRKSNAIFGGFISGKLLDSAIIGVLAYIILSIMKMPDTILVAVTIGVTNVIPFFGPFIGAIPSFIIIVLQNPIKGLYFLVFVVALQQVDGNIIGPKILGNSTGLSSFWVVFAILVFGGLWGFAGMLLGVPIMAVIYYIVQRTVQYFLRRRGLVTDTESYIHLLKVDKETNELVYEEEPGNKNEDNNNKTEPEEDEREQ